MYATLSFSDIHCVDISRDEDLNMFLVKIEAKEDDLVFFADEDDLVMIRAAIDKVIDGEGKLR